MLVSSDGFGEHMTAYVLGVVDFLALDRSYRYVFAYYGRLLRLVSH